MHEKIQHVLQRPNLSEEPPKQKVPESQHCSTAYSEYRRPSWIDPAGARPRRAPPPSLPPLRARFAVRGPLPSRCHPRF